MHKTHSAEVYLLHNTGICQKSKPFLEKLNRPLFLGMKFK